MLDFIIDNWFIIVVMLAAIFVLVKELIKFFNSDSEEQIAKLREWLLYATTLAEKELGGGTGKLKLRYVYDMFVVKFPWLAKVISFERFSELVDDVLIDMNELLTTNSAVNQYVNNSIEDKEE